MKLPINTAPELFIRLYYGLQLDFAKVAVIWVLLAKNADARWVECSSRNFSAALSNALPASTMLRALHSLTDAGVIERKPYPNRTTAYRINVAALLSALPEAMPDTPYMPGIGTAPLPFLTQLANHL